MKNKTLPAYAVGILRDIIENAKNDRIALNFSGGGVRNVERSYTLPKEYNVGDALVEMLAAGGHYEFKVVVRGGQIERQRVTEYIQPSV